MSQHPPRLLQQDSTSSDGAYYGKYESSVYVDVSQDEKKRQKRRWWIFGALAGAAVLLISLAVGLTFGLRSTSPSPTAHISPSSNTSSSNTSPSNTTSSNTTASNATTASGGRNGYQTIVLFGASYCDDAHPRPSRYAGSIQGPPYWQGRYSNGPTWGEYLKSLIGPQTKNQSAAFFDYAYGGATINNNITPGSVPDNVDQVRTYLTEALGGNSTVAATVKRGQGKTLIAIWMGINSVVKAYLSYIQNPTTVNLQRSKAALTASASTLVDELQILTNHESLYANVQPPDFLVMPIPPAEMIPSLLYMSRKASDRAVLRELGQTFNNGLATSGQELDRKWNGLVYTMDVDSLWRDMTADPPAFGLTNAVSPCVQNGVPCSRPSSFLYWDSTHPTTGVHELIAHKVREAIFNGNVVLAPPGKP